MTLNTASTDVAKTEMSSFAEKPRVFDIPVWSATKYDTNRAWETREDLASSDTVEPS